ncbi:5-formyltetrahydrofolate cyclo-ligase [Rothia nasimurium]|uniref:5-formyltetrahydrofolate cyclo-ligase n=1 Tax=Rothia nasimurium TaxID=85336 RepID=UPI003BA10914
MTDSKAFARSYLRRRRRDVGISADLRAAFTGQCEQLWARLEPVSTIAAFLPLPTEPPILDGLTRAVAAGHRVLVPVVEPGRTLTWVGWEPGAATVRNSLGIAEPDGQRQGPEAFVGADLRLVPALAFDLAGRRLGQGGGYYDRLFEQLGELAMSPTTVGVVFEREVVDAVPTDPWDATLGWVLTELGLRQLGVR